MTPERLRTADFDYDLPPELIAQEPLADRAASRLLMVLRADRRIGAAPDRRAAERPTRGLGRRTATIGSAGMLPGERRSVGGGVLADTWFAQLASLIPAGDLVVLNNDYFAVPDADLKKIRSILTVVGGTIVHDAGVLKVK